VTSCSGAAASTWNDGYFSSHSAYFGSTRSTCVCCSMISDTRMWYGSSVFRHGRARPWRRCHANRRWPQRRRAGGAGRRRGLRFFAMKIYTRTGDTGETSLFGGTRVGKDDPRVHAYGEVDELNAHIGLARANAADSEIDAELVRVQRDLFALGAQLADPRSTGGAGLTQARL